MTHAWDFNTTTGVYRCDRCHVECSGNGFAFHWKRPCRPAPPASHSLAEAGTVSADMLTRCETTGMASHNGSCLAHGGDACLWSLPNLRESWNAHVAEIAALKLALAQRGDVEAMRERCAEACDGYASACDDMNRRAYTTQAADFAMERCNAAIGCAAAIRSLPVPTAAEKAR